MAIKIEVQPYCGHCLEFEPDVVKPLKVTNDDGELILGDTAVRCKYAKRCENIKKYLMRQKKLTKD